MSIELDRTIIELTQSGATAALLLDAQRHLVAECVESALRKIDDAVNNRTADANFCIGVVYELSAFRRILARQQLKVDQGRAAEAHAKGQ